MKLYGIYCKKHKRLLTVDASADCGEFCSEVSYSFSLMYEGDTPWLVSTYDAALAAAENNPPWHSTGYSTPANGYIDDDLTVVEIELTTTHPGVEL